MPVQNDFLKSQQLILLALFSICLYVISVAIHRLCFSSLVKFPGPKLVALTHWVEVYYDIIKRGRYAFEIIKMHEKYGKSCLTGFDFHTYSVLDTYLQKVPSCE